MVWWNGPGEAPSRLEGELAAGPEGSSPSGRSSSVLEGEAPDPLRGAGLWDGSWIPTGDPSAVGEAERSLLLGALRAWYAGRHGEAWSGFESHARRFPGSPWGEEVCL